MSGWGVSAIGLSSTIDALESIRVDYDDGAAYLVGPTVEYSIYQERGTADIEARPFVRPAAEFVEANLASEVRRIASSQGLSLDTESDIVRAAALAVQDRIKRIADRKDIRDTGNLIASVTIEEI
jgi:hypothetical protein